MDQLHKEGFDILQYSFTDADFENDKWSGPPEPTFALFLELVSDQFLDEQKPTTALYESTRSIADKISEARETWAFRKAKATLKTHQNPFA